MTKFLDHRDLGPAIKAVVNAPNLRCAVAFWGDGAMKALFKSSPPPTGSRILCDLTLGGTNPKELRALGAPCSGIRHTPRLHAKVYISDGGVIVGSANSSDNGVGFTGVAGLIEAGTFHGSTSSVHRQASAWFEALWAESSEVNEAALAKAQLAWDRRPRDQSKESAEPLEPRSLFSLVAADPTKFRGVGFAFTSGRATKADRDKAVELVVAEDRKRPVRLLSKVAEKALAEWPVGDVFSGWGADDIRAWPQLFICGHVNRAGSFSYWFYQRDHAVIIEDDEGMVLASRPKGLRKLLGFSHSAGVMADVDRHAAAKVFGHIAENGHQLYESGEKLAELLRQLELN